MRSITSIMPQSVRKSVAWSAARNWGVRLGSVALFFVLARILPLHLLGLFSAAVSIIAFAELFAENGLGDAVVQATDPDERILSAAVWANLLFGLLCVAVLVAAAPWLESRFDAPGLAPVLSIAVAAIAMNSLSYIPQSLLRRRLEFRWLAVRALVATGVSGAIGIAMAVAGFGVTALIAQFLIASGLNLLFVWAVRPFRLQLVSPLEALPLIRFGVRVFGTKLLDYLASRSIELVVLAGLGAAALALYILASRLWAVLMQLVSAVTVDVSLPHFSRLAADREQLLAAFYAAVRVTLALGVPLFVLLGALAPEVMPVVFGDNGRGGAAILMPLALLGAFQIVQFYNGTLLTAIGRPDVSLRILLVRAALIAVVLAFSFGRPLQTTVAAFAVAQIAVTPLSFCIGRKYVGYSMKELGRIGLPFVIASVVAFAAVALARTLAGGSVPSPLLRGAMLAAAGGGCYFAVAMLCDRRGLMAAARSVTGGVAQGGKTNAGV